MTPERSKQIEKLYHSALNHEPNQRTAFLKEACGDDEALRKEVESLLAHQEQAENFIEEPALEVAAQGMAQNRSQSRVGRQIGSYKILSLLGMGGMGEVYLAEDSRLDRILALKVLPPELASDPDRMRRFVREARAASALNHANVAHIYEIGQSDGVHFIAMEYVEGQSLAQKMSGQPLELKEILDIGVQAADALEEAHRKGIAHRDIKSANLMITPKGQVKVLDFGLAKITRPEGEAAGSDVSTLIHTAEGMVMGTLRYMSPEQVLGKELDARTDLFSLGVVLYEMTTGRLPFSGSNASEVMDRILHAQPEAIARFNYEVPTTLERIIRKCLEKDRELRYQSARELLIDLKSLQREPDPQARVALADLPVEKRARLTPLRRIMLAGLVMLLVAAGFYFLSWRRKTAVGPSEIQSLAVLPLRNLGGGSEDEYLSDGITEELITKLTKLKNLRVVSHSVVMRFKNSPKDSAEIGRELGVEAVLNGSVRKAGSRFKVSIHLVNASDGFAIWSDNDFENELRDLIDAPGKLAGAVAARLKGQLTSQEHTLMAKRSTTNADAYELLLRGKEHFRQGELRLAKEMFERALSLDPNFADAQAWLGLALYTQFADGQADRTILDAAIARVNQALAIDPDLIVARRALVHIYHSTGQTEEGLKQAKWALDASPDDFDAQEAAALAYFRAGMIDKSIPLYQKALSLSPSDASIRSQLARCYLHTGEYNRGLEVLSPLLASNQGGEWAAMRLYEKLGQFDQAIEMGRRLVSIFPDSAAGWLEWGQVFLTAGQRDRAIATFREGAQKIETQLALVDNVRTRTWLSLLYAWAGDRDKAQEQANRSLLAEPNDPWVLFWICNVHSVLGNRSQAVDYLKRAVANGFLAIHEVKSEEKPSGGLYGLRANREYQAVRDALERKVEELKKRY